ncbi:MAG: ABC transporter substrate-binding protein [Devosia sp.]|uniref:extracellular solute-binding protein n=1 Tax=Devosia sp. TaxID=1871048 RepID=UPI001A499CC7|nr:extracellular solute-binding protein [Devosia sp.]MBL8598427.1 ABC transporter substrate-binding protein [Devosia sp.]
MTPILRASLLAAALLLAAAPAVADPAQNGEWHHATSLLGAPKYPADFAHFDYVNVDAPKGGLVRLDEQGSFDTFNPILPEGEPATGLGLVYETLAETPLDDTNASYGHVAEAWAYPPDISSTTFRLNARAKWQDGQPITAADVIWSFEKQTTLNPNLQQYYQDVSKVEETAPGEVTFFFSTTNNRELPTILGQMLVLPKHWWEGTDANGKQRDIGASTLELPMGSGPYKMKEYAAGASITYERDPNWWGAAEPIGIGQYNFDLIRFEYFRDLDVAFEGFKGDQFDWWLENRAARWANSYDFPAAQDGRVIKELFPNSYMDSGVMVGFMPNLRIDKFKDARVRHALLLAFDFESLNKTLFYDQYERVSSYFFGLPFASKGLPAGQELEILEAVKDEVPPEVFTSEYVSPVAGDPAKLRENLRQALALLTDAGYTLNGNQLVDAGGTQLSFEILLNGPTIEPVATAWQTNLRSIGIEASIRPVDSAEYINRVRSRDFEMIYSGWSQSMSPGNEQNFFFGSEAATDENSANYGGIADPGVDALIDRIVFAKDRDELLAATAALDRVLLFNYFVIPSYTLRNERVARWDRFSHPDKLPEFSIGFPQVWWYDEAKAAKTGVAQ